MLLPPGENAHVLPGVKADSPPDKNADLRPGEKAHATPGEKSPAPPGENTDLPHARPVAPAVNFGAGGSTSLWRVFPSPEGIFNPGGSICRRRAIPPDATSIFPKSHDRSALLGHDRPPKIKTPSGDKTALPRHLNNSPLMPVPSGQQTHSFLA